MGAVGPLPTELRGVTHFVSHTHFGAWELTDPVGRGIQSVRPIRDELKRPAESLPGLLGVSAVCRAPRRDALSPTRGSRRSRQSRTGSSFETVTGLTR